MIKIHLVLRVICHNNYYNYIIIWLGGHIDGDREGYDKTRQGYGISDNGLRSDQLGMEWDSRFTVSIQISKYMIKYMIMHDKSIVFLLTMTRKLIA